MPGNPMEIEESNSSNTQLILNTTQLSGPDFSNYLSLCEEVERLRVSQSKRLSLNNSIIATMTREEMFECSTLNDDEFLSALEHQNSYIAPTPSKKPYLSSSIENMLQYFDEDISISSKSNRSTPTNFATIGKVATVVANFTKKCETVTSPTSTIQKPVVPTSGTIKELKAKYEAAMEPSKGSLSNKVSSNENNKIQSPPLLKAPTLIAAVKLKSTAEFIQSSINKKELKSASPKLSRKSKVKQIAQMFNTKISQLVHRNPAEVGYFAPLNNEFSPDPKSKLMPSPTSAPKPNFMSTPISPPIPKPRSKVSTKPPTYRIRSPKPSPRLRRRASLKANGCKGLLAENAFGQLSVRDKVLLYTKFIEDMYQKDPEFSKHAEMLESKVHKQFARGEVVAEKQESVKHLTEELESKCAFPKQTISPRALMRMQSVNDVTFIAKKGDGPTQRDEEVQQMEQSIKEGTGFFRADLAQVDDAKGDQCEDESLHVSSLTVVLKPSPKSKLNSSSPTTARPKPLSRNKRNQRLLSHLSLFEPIQKRGNDSIRSCHLSTELYAPPKKIRRTRSERLNPQQFFQNEQLEQLFFSWIKERNGLDFDIAHSDDEKKFVKIVQADQSGKSVGSDVTQKSAVERLLEEAIAKLENTSISNNSKDFKTLEDTKEVKETPEDIPDETETAVAPQPAARPSIEAKKKSRRKQKAPAPPVSTHQTSSESTSGSSAKQSDVECESGVSTLRKAPAPAPPVPAPRKIQVSTSTTTDSGSSSTKHSDIDSESGVSTLPKMQSDDSQPENCNPKSTTTSEFEFIKPEKPPRKKKMRRNLSLKNEATMTENPAEAATTTTDSDSDYKVKEVKKSPSPTKPKERGNHIKKLCFRTLKAITASKHGKPSKTKSEETPIGLNKKFLRVVNSPRRIKSAYTLTVLSSPSPYTESEQSEPKAKRRSSHSLSASSSVATQTAKNTTITQEQRPVSANLIQRPLSDSYIDQGFETGTNSIDSPVRRPRASLSDPLFIDLSEMLRLPRLSCRTSIVISKPSTENPSNYSTPVKGHVQKSFISPKVAQQQVFSPIQAQSSVKTSSRRASAIDTRRSSIAMQVIQEDHPYDSKHDRPSRTSDILNANESAFFANATTLDMPSNFDFSDEKPHSTFWIMVGDYTVSIKIFYNTLDRLRLLYDIFSQKNSDFRKLHFGIDDHRFLPYGQADNLPPLSARLPPAKDTSHYWFSTGDLAVPFNGTYMPGKKVRRLFKFIYSVFEPDSILRFGVDKFEFTHPPERMSTTAKLSMESSYSMLVGLQSGGSNGLEGRSRFAWPNPMCSFLNANNVKTSDLDHSDLDSASLRSSDMRRQSDSSYCNSPISSLNTTPRTSGDTSSPEMYYHIYENDPLAQIYKDAMELNLAKSQIDNMPHQKTTIPELLQILQDQQSKLKTLEQSLKSYNNSTTLEHLKETPEYLRKLKNITKVIENIGRDSGLRACSLQQLESAMFFLSRYAEIFLTKCSDHLNQVQKALQEQHTAC